jgi:hypothetical protein
LIQTSILSIQNPLFALQIPTQAIQKCGVSIQSRGRALHFQTARAAEGPRLATKIGRSKKLASRPDVLPDHASRLSRVAGTVNHVQKGHTRSSPTRKQLRVSDSNIEYFDS